MARIKKSNDVIVNQRLTKIETYLKGEVKCHQRFDKKFDKLEAGVQAILIELAEWRMLGRVTLYITGGIAGLSAMGFSVYIYVWG